MDHSTSDCQLNTGEVDYDFESNEVPEPVYLQFMALKPLSVVDDELVPKVAMTFTTLEDAGKFYRNYAKVAGFSTRVRCTNRKGNEIKNQLITCSREGKWKSKISPTKKTNPTAGLNCPARIYIHTLKDVGAWIISKVVLDHSHPCCPSKAEMLKQHRELSMSIRRTIENNEEADLYEHRHIWVPIYLDHHFWAGMRSTQRSESMHSFFNKYITRNSSLIQFVKQYDNCLGSREQAERESDAADFHTVIPCATKSSIEAQFQDAYTHAKFREVQAQFRGKANCITRLKNSALGYSVYEVGEQVSSSIFNKFVVTYDSVAAEVKCQCLLFESRGILCRHALSVLSFEQVSQVSPRYILERWSKKVKRRHTHIKSSHDEPLMEPRSKRFDQLVFRSQNICEFASESEELTVILHRAYDNVMVEMESLKAKRKGTSSLSHEDANLESVNELQSPPRIRTRGRPKNRLGSKLDKQIANATKKKKTKVLSEINLFDAASVVHSNSSQYQGHVMNYQFRVPAAGDNSLGV
ncbi:Protein FAR-RED ELONGATED HYPOCOTYL [Arachis hypogaea]|nr:Protein FAR-RED ELONGATED HYPOCOTYL [Arachis hypogaea]